MHKVRAAQKPSHNQPLPLQSWKKTRSRIQSWKTRSRIQSWKMARLRIQPAMNLERNTFHLWLRLQWLSTMWVNYLLESHFWLKFIAIICSDQNSFNRINHAMFQGVVLGMLLMCVIFGGLLIGLRKDSCSSSFLPSSLPGYHLLLGQRSNRPPPPPHHHHPPHPPPHHPHPNYSREPDGETLCSEEVPESAWI